MSSRLGVIVTLGCTQALAWASSFYLPGVLAGSMARDLGLSPPWIYAALSAGMGVSAVLGPALGRHVDREGGRGVLCASNLGFALGLVLLALAVGPLSLVLAWLVIGAAMAAGFYETAFGALARRYGHDARGAITGITLIAGFSSTIGWPTSAYLEQAFGWRGACLTWAALHVVLGLPAHAWALRDAGSPMTPARTSQPGIADRGARGDRDRLLLSFMFTAAGMVTIGMATNLPRLFFAIGAAPAAAIAAASLLGPSQVVARILEFGARRHINPLVSARMANVLHPLAALALGVGGAPAIAVFSVLHGAGAGLLTICRGTLPLALFGPEGYGARIGRINAPVRIGQALAPFLVGLAIDRLGAITLIATCGLSLSALMSLSWLSPPSPVFQSSRS